MNAMPVKSAGSADTAASWPACAGGIARAGSPCAGRTDRETAMGCVPATGAEGGGAGGGGEGVTSTVRSIAIAS
jgi:hypothetical protein